MKTQSIPVVSEEAGSLIAVRVPLADEVEWFDGLLADHHYLGAGRAVGDYLRQVVEREGKAVALVVWGPACYALKDRDLWISWSASQRLERLKLIVQNRRFLVLAPKGESPNLASQAMGAALRALPDQWREHFGYRPLLAESFTDPEAYAGTCYKASNWEAVGHSAGYRRHRADFYLPNDRPKRLWLRPLAPDARQVLRSVQVPESCRAGLVAAPSGTLPINAGQLDSLLDVFRKAPDPRDTNTRYRIGPVLTLIAMALLAGRREIAEIARFATTLTQPQRRRLGLPLKKGTRAFYEVPGYGVFYQVLTRMDPEAFATRLNEWLLGQADALPQALALDGKMIRDHIGLLTLAQHEDGAPQALAVYDQKEGTPRCEQTAAAGLLEKLPALDGKIITADPLHCQRKTAARIVEKGGDYLLQIKGNQPNLLKQAQGLDALQDTPFLPTASQAMGASKSATCMPSPSNRCRPTSPTPEP
jgi:predicted transposase YbfD/YdcC